MSSMDLGSSVLSAFSSAAQTAAQSIAPLIKTIRKTIENSISNEEKDLLQRSASDLNVSSARIRTTTEAVIKDPIIQQLWQNAADIAKAGGQIRNDPLNGGVSLILALGGLSSTLFNAGSGKLNTDDKESIATKAIAVIEALQDFAAQHPDLVKGGIAVGSMVVADPYLAAMVVSAQLYFGYKKIDSKTIDVPAKVVSLSSMLQRVLPMTFAMQSVLALAYVVHANKPPEKNKATRSKLL